MPLWVTGEIIAAISVMAQAPLSCANLTQRNQAMESSASCQVTAIGQSLERRSTGTPSPVPHFRSTPGHNVTPRAQVLAPAAPRKLRFRPRLNVICTSRIWTSNESSSLHAALVTDVTGIV